MIWVENVSVRYPTGTVGLQPVSIDFAPSQVTVLLGRSGAGKSTLLRTLNGLTAATTGRIRVAEIGDIGDRRQLRAHRRRTAMIFQQHQLIGRYTALKNVLVGRIGWHPAWRTFFPSSREERVLAYQALERVDLLDKALQRVDALSGGQQQRVGIARALAQQPKLILADEPVASLDPATSERVLKSLHQICKNDGIPAIISLHQVELARAFADRIVGLHNGQVVFDGPPAALNRKTLDLIYDNDGTETIRGTGNNLDDDSQPKLEVVG